MRRPQNWPVAVRTLDIREPIQPLTDATGYPRTRVFVFDADKLVGSMDIRNARGPISAATLRQHVTNHFAWTLIRRALRQQIGGDESEVLPPDVSVSVVIPTCNRPDDLRRCLMAVRAQVSPRPIEIIVVDNRPAESSTPQVVSDFPGVIPVSEPRPGLSYARNAGFLAATGDILVAIDDDVTVPEGWIERLVAPFVRAEVMAVTGHVLPVELETEAQCRFEAYGGLGKGFERFEVDGAWFRAKRAAVPTWQLGATANAAFRASIFARPEIGLLDEALGAGMPTGCSEDTYMFYRILKAGGRIVYESTAWVWHRHRTNTEALTDQIFAYSKGHIAYQLTTLLRDGDRRALVRMFYSLPKVYAWRVYARLRGWSDYPISLILTEIAGNLAGPWALWQARRRVRRLGRSGRTDTHAVPLESPASQAPAS